MSKFEPNDLKKAGQHIDEASRVVRDGQHGKAGVFTTAWGTKPPNKIFCKEGCTCKRHTYKGAIARWIYKSPGESYEIPYIDDGCDVSPSCLECPLSECKYVDSVPYKEWKLGVNVGAKLTKIESVHRILDLQSEGFTSREICDQLNISNIRDLRYKVISEGYQWEGDYPFIVKRSKMNEK